MTSLHEKRQLSRETKQPLWRQLRADLVSRIDAGEFDQEFPGEHTLAQSYEVSRQTVRFALRDLRSAGILSAERGRPPRVQHPIRQPMGAIYSLFSSVRAAGMSQRSVVLALDKRTHTTAAAALSLAASEPLVYLERLRLAGEEPLAWDRVWLPFRIAEPLLDVDFTNTALYLEMHQRLGCAPSGGREEIGCRNTSASEAELLNVQPGSSTFELRRLGCHHSEPVEHRETLVRGDRFSLLAQFSPASGYFVAPGMPTTQSTAQRLLPPPPDTSPLQAEQT